MAQLASLAGRIRIGFSRELSAHGIFFVGQPRLSTMDQRWRISLHRPHRGHGWAHSAVMQRPHPVWLCVDGRLRRGLAFPPNNLGQRRVVVCAVSFLPGTIPRRVSVSSLFVAVPSTGRLGRPPRPANRLYPVWRRTVPRPGAHRFIRAVMEQ